MHTFFINTSGKDLGNCAELFEIQTETRRLVPLDCPLAKWNDQNEGYEACVKHMGEQIDNYKDINNDFNLILYIDLLNYEAYTAIPMKKHRERYACLKALRSLLKHYIRNTLLQKMEDTGRAPKEILLIFEENELPKDRDERTEDGKAMIRAYTKAFLGLPESEKLDTLLGMGPEADGPAMDGAKFCDAAEAFDSCLGRDILRTYIDQVELFITECKGQATVAEPVEILIERILACSAKDDKSLASVSFVTNRRAGVANKQERTHRDLRLCFYILQCVEDGTIFDKKTLEDEPAAKQFPQIDWEAVVGALATKSQIYQQKHKELNRQADQFAKMELAPPLYAFDHQRFAMDEYGNREKSIEVVDAQVRKDAEQEEKDKENGLIRSQDEKAVVVNKVTPSSQFTEEEYALFDYNGGPAGVGKLGSRASAEEYIKEATKLRKHHLDYLQRLRVHVSDRVSNYAGRSAENDPALLRKRKVSLAEEDFEDTGRDYCYAKKGNVEETRKIKTVKPIAETAYTTALIDYMEFCAGRSVAVTDIEEHCDWFTTCIFQIKKSLQKIKAVAIGLLIGLLVLYIPFFVLQWEAIRSSSLTLLVAAASLVIPVALLYIVFAIMTALQRRKYQKTWDEFKDKSDKVLAENALAAEKYDQLLNTYVPALRWVYEYLLDVEFYAECCDMAMAKKAHHMQKLYERVVAIGNIIEDLEMDPEVLERPVKDDNEHNELDCHVSFCTGKKNRAFYSIVDKHFLETVHK